MRSPRRRWTWLVLPSLWLAWRAPAAALALARELARAPRVAEVVRLPEDERIARTLAHRDRDLGLPPGYQLELWSAVDAHVPTLETVHVVGLTDKRVARALLPLRTVGTPRRISRELLFPPEGWRPESVPWVLLYGAERKPELARSKALVAAGPDWTLWR